MASWRLRSRKSSGGPSAVAEGVCERARAAELQADHVGVDVAEYVSRGDPVIRLDSLTSAGCDLLVDGVSGHRQVQRAVAIAGLAKDAAVEALADDVVAHLRGVRAVAARVDVDAVCLG